MIKLLQSIFRQTPDATGGGDDKLIALAIERVVDGTDTRLRALPGYQKKLRPAVIKALDYTIDLANTLAQPIHFSARQFGRDNYIRSFFASPERIDEFLTQSRSLQDYLKRRTGLEPEWVHALLTMTRKERNVFGMEMMGETFRRDVAQVSVSFANPRLSAVKDDASKSTFEMKKDVFDYFVDLALRDIVDARVKQQEEKQQHDLLARKRHTLIAGDWGMRSLFTGKDDQAIDNDSTEVELGQLDTELQRRETAPLTLDNHLESIIRSLNLVHERLWHEPVQVRLNRMGIKSEQNNDSVLTLQLNEYCNIEGDRIIALPVQIPFDSIPVRQDLLAEIDRYL